jgi:hypothetical protein
MRHWLTLAVIGGLLLSAACKDNKDVIAPSVDLTTPVSGDTLMPGDTITITAHATDNKAVKVVEFYRDTVKLGQQEVGTSGNYSLTWDVPLETLGAAHVLVVKAFDGADNSATDSAVVYIRRTGGGPKYHGGSISASETWYPTVNPHICTTDVTISAGATLTILPGCDVRFAAGAGIKVGQGGAGDLVAVGKPDSLIVFTSNAATPARGDWSGLGFFEMTGTSTRLSYCTVSYGGPSSGAAIVVDGSAAAVVDNCTIEQSAGYGTWYANNGRFAGFSDNRITNCGSYPVRVKAEHIGDIGTGNQLTGNAEGFDGVYVDGSAVTATALWRNPGVPYRVNGAIAIGGTSQPVVTIEPGTTISIGQNSGISVGENLLPGALKADAFGGQRIVFTSLAATPGRGDWAYLYFYPTAIMDQCKLVNCRIAYGGRNGDGEVYLYDANFEISGCAIDSSGGYGIYLDGNPGSLPDPAALRASNTFQDNELGDIYGP